MNQKRAGMTERPPQFELVLYVAGVDPKSVDAIKAITGLCGEHLEGRYRLAIVDIYQEPSLAREERIIAAPTLIIRRPPPSRRLVGSMEGLETILAGLGRMPPA
jgi:circadian clock protein KaiB